MQRLKCLMVLFHRSMEDVKQSHPRHLMRSTVCPGTRAHSNKETTHTHTHTHTRKACQSTNSGNCTTERYGGAV
eukprot:3034981-Amphidinium_carterae.1